MWREAPFLPCTIWGQSEMTLQVSKPQFRLGVSPLSWTNDVLPELGGDVPLEVFLREAAEIGYEGVELGRKFPRKSEELLPKLSEYGLQLVSGWYSGFLTERPLEEEWKAAADHVRLLEECRCNVFIYGECGSMPSDSPWDTRLGLSPKLESIDLESYASKSCRKSIKLAATQALRSRAAPTPLRGKRMAFVFVGEAHALGFSSRRSSWSEPYRAPPQRGVRCNHLAPWRRSL